MLFSVRDIFQTAPSPPDPAPSGAAVTLLKSPRHACRADKLTDLAEKTGNERRDAIARLWVLAGCKACGACADMVAR